MDLELLNIAIALDEQEDDEPRDLTKCQNCGSSEFIEIDYERICESCHAIDPHYAVFATSPGYSTYQQRYAYSCTNYFIKAIQRYQGKQNCTIPDVVYENLKDVEPTRENILRALKEFKLTRHYKNAHRIYHDLTGKFIDDIEHLERQLLSDYNDFIRVYHTLGIDRKNFLNVQYVLYHLLRRHGHPCDARNFSLPRTDACKAFHNEIFTRVFHELGWEFITT